MSNWWDLLGYAGAALTLVSLSMKTMIPLRAVAIACNVLLLAYGYSRGTIPTMIVHGVSLPINLWRLREMIALTRRVRDAARGDLSMDWLKPFMSRRRCAAGEVLFRRGDAADAMYYVTSGHFRLTEIAVDLKPGEMVGELGLIAPDRSRTQTLVCVVDGDLLTITYDQVRRLYFQNPGFGFYLLRLCGERLFDNLRRTESTAT